MDCLNQRKRARYKSNRTMKNTGREKTQNVRASHLHQRSPLCGPAVRHAFVWPGGASRLCGAGRCITPLWGRAVHHAFLWPGGESVFVGPGGASRLCVARRCITPLWGPAASHAFAWPGLLTINMQYLCIASCFSHATYTSRLGNVDGKSLFLCK